jgi:Putative DNA-binding domain
MMALPQPLPELARLQRWMQTVVSHPDGIADGIDSEEARGEMAVASQQVESVIRPSKRMTGVERLEVYGGAYYTRLLECLEAEFPAVTHALGREAFDEFGFLYLQQYPSRSYTLAFLGENFPNYLAENRLPYETDDGVPDWADFLIDLAHLERLYSRVFDGPGTEKLDTLHPDALLAIPPDRWPRVRFEMAPCLRVAKYRFPVQSYASAVRQKRTEIAMPDPLETHLAVSRINYRVRRWSVSREQYRLLESLIAGNTLQQSLETAFADSTEDDATLAANLKQWFHEWADAGFFLSVDDVERHAKRQAGPLAIGQ